MSKWTILKLVNASFWSSPLLLYLCEDMRRTLLILLLAVPTLAFAQRDVKSTRLELTSALDASPDSAAMQLLLHYREAVDSIVSPVVGRSEVAMEAGRPESLLGNWVADAMMDFSDFDGGGRADLGIVNVGSLRRSVPQGDVTRGDVMLIIPFQDNLAVAYLTGRDLLSLMEEIALTGGEAVSHEVRMTMTPDGRLKEVSIGGLPIDEERTYRVVTLDYLAEGNDRMPSFAKAGRVEIGDQCIRDILVESVQRSGVITSSLEDRIKVEEE